MSANRYTPDGSAIIDATGKQWPVETPHELPLPEGIDEDDFDGNFVRIIFGNPAMTSWSCHCSNNTHWLARRPLPPVPKPKTQEELDEEAFVAYWNQDYSPQRIVMGHEDTWRAAIAYARKGAK